MFIFLDFFKDFCLFCLKMEKVKIEIRNVVDKAPYFEYNYYSFKIKIPYDVYIGQIKAIDVEKTSNMSYALEFVNQNDDNLFCITQTGTIYICQSLFTRPDAVQNSLDDILAKFKYKEYRLTKQTNKKIKKDELFKKKKRRKFIKLKQNKIKN